MNDAAACLITVVQYSDKCEQDSPGKSEVPVSSSLHKL